MSQLRKLRKDKGFTLKALAELSGVHYVSLARLEAGKFDPRLSTLRKLAKALKVTVYDLIDDQPPCPGSGVEPSVITVLAVYF